MPCVGVFVRLFDVVRYDLFDVELLGVVILIVFFVVGMFLRLTFRFLIGDEVFYPFRNRVLVGAEFF